MGSSTDNSARPPANLSPTRLKSSRGLGKARLVALIRAEGLLVGY